MEHRIDAGGHLRRVSREIQPRLVAVFQPVVGKKIVDAEMAGVVRHVVNAGMGEVA